MWCSCGVRPHGGPNDGQQWQTVYWGVLQRISDRLKSSCDVTAARGTNSAKLLGDDQVRLGFGDSGVVNAVQAFSSTQ